MAIKNQYPAVFVHGVYGWGMEEGIDKKMPYWGASSGNLMQFLAENGYAAFALSVGPVSSAWDRCCEMYACLTGTTVDYGKAHAKAHDHRRFGRTYEKPLFEGFSAEEKIHLIGHSFGGITVRLFAHLMAFGSEAERAVTDEKDLSGLFTGGKGDWIASVTTLCAPHNGSTLFDLMFKTHIMPVVKRVTLDWVTTVGRTPLQSRLVDFHMEQFGANNTPGKRDLHDFFQVRRLLKVTQDSVQYDMSNEGTARLSTQMQPIVPNIYYFSYYFNAMEKSDRADRYRPANANFKFLSMTSDFVMLMCRRAMLQGKMSFEDVAGDGLVHISSAMHPNDQPFKLYDADHLEPGIWNVMPERKGDHGTAIGLFAPPEQTHAFYLELMELLCRTEHMSDSELKES